MAFVHCDGTADCACEFPLILWASQNRCSQRRHTTPGERLPAGSLATNAEDYRKEALAETSHTEYFQAVHKG
jgi:hypothetical protein